MTVANTDQAITWNSYQGQHWATHRHRYDAVNSGFNHYLLAAIDPRDRVLDIGCGTGQVTRLAGRRAGDGQVLGIDLSRPMLREARAATAAEGPGNVTFVEGDAQVHGFAPAEFDLAISRFGIMFFADPIAAFRNLGRAIRPQGRLATLTMRPLPEHDLAPVLAAVESQLPADPDQQQPNPALSFADPSAIERVLTEAGFHDISVVAVSAPQVLGGDLDEATDFLAGWGPLQAKFDRLAPPAARRAREALRDALSPYLVDGEVRLESAAWLTTAVRS